MTLCFSKYQGTGNDFILVDDRRLQFPVEKREWIVDLCHRRLGIGADGILLLQTSDAADFRMRIFNSDGTEAAMCGNGVRCLTHFLRHNLEIKGDRFTIETKAGIIPCHFEGEKIAVHMGKPKIIHWDLSVHGSLLHLIDTGVPHAVIFKDEFPASILDEARKIRFHPYFHPEGVNVNFAQLTQDGNVRFCTYERGVEAETFSCGTGAAATALVAAHLYKLANPVTLITAAKQILEVDVGTEVVLKGTATHVFDGFLRKRS